MMISWKLTQGVEIGSDRTSPQNYDHYETNEFFGDS